MKKTEVAIVGAGLAGLTAAIELAEAGYGVVVFEKHPFPRHKVCGEYLSREVVPYLESIEIPLSDAPQIDKMVLATGKGKLNNIDLPLGGIGISRYALDERLYRRALKSGVQFIFESVYHIHFDDSYHRLDMAKDSWGADLVIGSWGKRSGMDRELNRNFFKSHSSWMGIKMHFKAKYPRDQVGLYFFRGGYGGLSVTETGSVNFCFLIQSSRFKETPNLSKCMEGIIAEHPDLDEVLADSEPLFPQALSISQISFKTKRLVEDHILLAGDAARLIHPLTGNGMAMAIGSGRRAAHWAGEYLSGRLTTRQQMEACYSEEWLLTYRQRLWYGRQLQRLLTHPVGSRLGLDLATHFPSLLKTAIRKTHGTKQLL
ncbi:NAD(P)/FAD-dependent oxidoreductase [Robiginitalea sp. IMCC43444]|uniref:NAD(P)/FAD-dependent oxidoreductase n=1 Tax=Robiginitalea sp. IMCC43444 TaxID=3459121 RepID=UPI0040435164